MVSYVFVFDFESFGGSPKTNGFTELGAVLMEVPSGKVFEQFHSYASQEGLEREQRCMSEFWANELDRYNETVERTMLAPSPSSVVASFIWWVKDTATTYNIKNNVHLLTDNAGFDLALLAHYSYNSIHYVFGEYRTVIDSTMYYKGLLRSPLTVATSKQITSTKDAAFRAITGGSISIPPSLSHNPVEDAINIGKWWCAIQCALALT